LQRKLQPNAQKLSKYMPATSVTREVQSVMHHHLIGPFWGNLVIVCIAGSITAACFMAMFRMLAHPGETDHTHPKFMVLRHDR
jgi:hypothetical protein